MFRPVTHCKVQANEAKETNGKGGTGMKIFKEDKKGKQDRLGKWVRSCIYRSFLALFYFRVREGGIIISRRRNLKSYAQKMFWIY